MIQILEEMNEAYKARNLGEWLRSLLVAVSKSHFNYVASFVVDAGCPVLFGYFGLMRHPGWYSGLLAFVLGLLGFTLAEYAIHRWLLHNPASVLYEAHENHHLNPQMESATFFLTSIGVLLPVWYLFSEIFHVPGTSFFICGFSACYSYYGLLHHFEHRTRINAIPFRWLQSRWAAHSVHHHIAGTNFGVMTSFWDYVFGTHQKQLKRKSMGA